MCLSYFICPHGIDLGATRCEKCEKEENNLLADAEAAMNDQGCIYEEPDMDEIKRELDKQ